MKRHPHTPEQAVRKPRKGERMLNEGQDLTEVLRHLEITESTWHRWRQTYGGMKADAVKRLKELGARDLGAFVLLSHGRSHGFERAGHGNLFHAGIPARVCGESPAIFHSSAGVHSNQLV